MSGNWSERIEHLLENRIIFGARWLLAPAYVVLVLALAVLCYKTVEEFVQMLVTLHQFHEAKTTAQVLVIVDGILVMNLVLMVLFVGYVNFVSVIHPEKAEDWPKWLGTLDYSGLKIQVLGSIIAISAIKLLRVFVDLAEDSPIDLTRTLLLIAILITFLIAALVMAIVNKLKESTEHPRTSSRSGNT